MSDDKAVPQKPLVIYLIAGEASGDLLGAHLMRSIRAKAGDRPVKFFGVGGDKMAEEGLKTLFPHYELSMLGFIEVLPYAFNIAARIHLVVEDILAKQPDVLVTIDVPGFNLRVIKKLKKEKKLPTKFVHYVAPTVWAYNPQRAEICAAHFDHIMVLLPFEPPYFEKAGLPCTYVGHPVVAETKPGNGDAFRTKYEIPAETQLFCLLPGSRKGEVERHMPIFAQVIRLLSARYPDLALAVAAPRNVLNYVAPYFEGCPYRAVITSNEQDKKDAIAASNIAIVKSGTITLEVAMAGTPMIVAYKVNPLSAWALRRIMLTKFVTLINILLGREAVPELLQELCAPLMIADAAAHLLDHKNARDTQIAACREALAMLMPQGEESPSDRAASVVLNIAAGKDPHAK